MLFETFLSISSVENRRNKKKKTHLVARQEQGGPDKYSREGLSGQRVEEHLVFYDGPVAGFNDGHVGGVGLHWEDWRSQVDHGIIVS